MSQKDLLPELIDIVALEPEEIGGLALYLIGLNRRTEELISLNGVLASQHLEKYRGPQFRLIKKVFAESWAWLAAEGLIAPDPDQSAGWYFVTRRGLRLMEREAFKSYLSNRALKKELLHPLIVERSWNSFLRGDYDSAVFAAFKEVEIQVRTIGRFGSDIYGTQLMRRAFNADGPLAPKDRPAAEQEAMLSLFTGAIGWFKNPQSHRLVGIGQMNLAAQGLMFASHLLYLAESNTHS